MRGYAKKQGIHLKPTELGIALVETYQNLGFDLSKPNLRAKMEDDMRSIAEGSKTSKEVIDSWVGDMLSIYK